MNVGWFEAEDELDEIQAAFVQVLRAEAETWPLDPVSTRRSLPYYLLTVGAYLDRDRVAGDELHNQRLTLPATPTPIGFEEHGTPQFLAARTAQWFGGLLRRPIVCREWLRSGEVYARRWIFADSGQPLVEGRIRTGELGPPDRIIPVRGQPA